MSTLGTITPGVPPVDTRPKARTLAEQMEMDASGVFMNSDDFARVVSWQPRGEPSRIIKAIYDAPTPTLDMVHGVAITLPTLTCAASDVPRAKPGDQAVVNRKLYTVHAVRDDGTGIVTLEISEDSDA